MHDALNDVVVDSPLPVLSAVALNASAATRTVTAFCHGYNYLCLWVVFTRNAATTVVATPTARHSAASTNDFQLPVVDITTSLINYGFPAHSYTTSASGKFIFIIPVPVGVNRMDVVLSGASAGGSDLVTVYQSLVRTAT